MRLKINLFFFIWAWNHCIAQDSLFKSDEYIIESSQESIYEVNDLNDLVEDHTFNMKVKVNINKGELQALLQIPQMSYLMAFQLIHHIHAYGSIIHINELQTIEGFTPEIIHVIRPFISLNEQNENAFRKLDNWSYKGNINSYRKIELSDGYSKPDSIKFQGNPYKIQCKFNASKGKQLSYGWHAEKDAGESYKWSFISAYFQYKGKGKQFILGDFRTGFAQGLLFGSGLSLGKSSQVLQIVKQLNGSKPSQSFNETGYLRGMSIAFLLLNKIEINYLTAYQFEGASVFYDSIEGIRYGSSYGSGLYRNFKEQEKRHSKQIFVTACNAQTNFAGLTLGTSAKFSKNNLVDPIKQNISPLRFEPGSEKFLWSCDWQWQNHNALYFGELTMNSIKQTNILSGTVIAMGKHTDCCFLFRKYTSGMMSNTANAFGESSSNQNESGLYSALSFKLNKSLKLQAYNDLTRSKSIKYRVNAPSYFNEQFIELYYTKRHVMECYFRYKQSLKQINISDNSHTIPELGEQQKRTFRFHLDCHLENVRLRSRYEETIFNSHQMFNKKGHLLYQDIEFNFNSKYRFSFRYTLFNSEIYECRSFAFENGLPGNYSMQTYYGSGRRYYVLINYRYNKNLRFWIRFARTYYYNQTENGSGLDTIPKPHNSELQIQLQWNLTEKQN